VGRSLLILLWIGGSSLSEDTALTEFYFMKSLSGGLKPDSFASSVTFCKAKNHCSRKVGFMFCACNCLFIYADKCWLIYTLSVLMLFDSNDPITSAFCFHRNILCLTHNSVKFTLFSLCCCCCCCCC